MPRTTTASPDPVLGNLKLGAVQIGVTIAALISQPDLQKLIKETSRSDPPAHVSAHSKEVQDGAFLSLSAPEPADASDEDVTCWKSQQHELLHSFMTRLEDSKLDAEVSNLLIN